ncbi:MAG: hypothetical protein LC797_08110 [Chloroflexi bacterium]|nr:hypothetical protein [Chloroflexota bacterium]
MSTLPGTLNIASYSDDWRSRLLSTFAHTPFSLTCADGFVRCASVEGFWQGLKWPEDSADRERVFGLWGLEAKLASHGAPATTHVRFCGRDVVIGSPDHHHLARLAIRAKLEQNPEVQRALEATDDLIFTHILLDETGKPYPDSATLPAAVFCAIWTELRRGWAGPPKARS